MSQPIGHLSLHGKTYVSCKDYHPDDQRLVFLFNPANGRCSVTAVRYDPACPPSKPGGLWWVEGLPKNQTWFYDSDEVSHCFWFESSLDSREVDEIFKENSHGQ